MLYHFQNYVLDNSVTYGYYNVQNAINDFINVILSHTGNVSEIGDLTDDDFLNMVEKMKNNK